MNPNRTRREIDESVAKFLNYAARVQESSKIYKKFAWFPARLANGEWVWLEHYYTRNRIVYYQGYYKSAKYSFSEEDCLRYRIDGTIINGEWQEHETNNSNN